jgi:hypothetical protein
VIICRDWLHDDGLRIIARKAGTLVRLYSRPGNDLTAFPLIVEALARLRSRSYTVDGEAFACVMTACHHSRYYGIAGMTVASSSTRVRPIKLMNWIAEKGTFV